MRFIANTELRNPGVTFGLEFRDIEADLPPASTLNIFGWAAVKGMKSRQVTFSWNGCVYHKSDVDHTAPKYHSELIRTRGAPFTDIPYSVPIFFYARFSRLNLPVGVPINVDADFETPDGKLRRIRVGHIVIDDPPPLSLTYSPKFRPIIMPALGRSGTTLLMTYFSSHPEILVPGAYPYELRQASYLWHSIEVLTSPADFRDSMHPDGFEEVHRRTIGYNPYFHRQYEATLNSSSAQYWQERLLVEDYINFTLRNIDMFFDALARDYSKPHANAFAEKVVISAMNDLVLNIYPNAREVILVRDFRDSFVSAKRFNEKRGTKSFGEELFSDDTTWLKSRSGAVKRIKRLCETRGSRSLVIRYEDLILDTEATLTRLFAYVGCDHRPQTIKNVIAAASAISKGFASHRTTATPAESVYRWRRDMTEEQKRLSLEFFGEALEYFGYPKD